MSKTLEALDRKNIFVDDSLLYSPPELTKFKPLQYIEKIEKDQVIKDAFTALECMFGLVATPHIFQVRVRRLALMPPENARESPVCP